jgi:hypothetical protein
MSSGARVLLSSSRVQPIEPTQAEDQIQSQENGQTKAVNRPLVYESGQHTKSSSSSEASHSVDIEA